MKFLRKEVQIALVAIVAIVVLFFGMKFLKGLSLFSTDNVYYIKFDNISGLSSSSPVYANGFRVGVVKDIVYNYERSDEIFAVVGLDNRLHMPVGTKAELESDMLGNIKINLTMPVDMSHVMAVGDTINGVVEGGALAQAAEMIPAIQQMLPKLDSILTSLNTILADPAISSSIHNVDVVTSNLTTTTSQLNVLMSQLNRDVPGMMTKANNVLDNTNRLTENLSQLDVASTMAKADETLENVREMTAALNNRQGSLGLLPHDPGLYNNLNSTMRSADSLLIDLRKHPKRYVHFSVF
jgi:phospholipid/cholesterol/gamma-HCH transport system substrate-binding protein